MKSKSDIDKNDNQSKSEELINFLILNEDDLEEKFVRSQGPGGQNVNKVATCVQLKHIPTGIEVKCSTGRTQAANRTKARKILAQKVYKYYENHKKKLQNELEKKRRKNRAKPMSVKIKILEEKKLHSQKKQMRKKKISVQEDFTE